MVAAYQLPNEHEQDPSWTADEGTPFSSDEDGYPCEDATVASIVWEPTAGPFTKITLIFEGFKVLSGWTILAADEITHLDNDRHADKRIDVTDFIRFGWRATSSIGGTAAKKFTAFGRG